MKMTLSHYYLEANLDILEGLGFPKSRALKHLGLTVSPLETPLARLDIEPFIDCINAAAEFVSDDNIALRLGHKFRVGNFGQTGNLYAYSANLKAVILMNDLYQKVAIDAGRVEYVKDPAGGHHMCFRPYYSDIDRYRPITDMIMASYVTTYRWLTWGSGESILTSRLPYSRPNDISAHEEIFKSGLIFDSTDICLEFTELAMTQRITTHDPERLARTRIKLDAILGVQMASQDFEQAVTTAILGALDAGQVSSHIIADRMGLSWSSLRSKLTESGEGIRSRIDRVRKRKFIEGYKAGLSFSQIAMSLAYNDQAAMNRAFKRWFDMTPSEWKRQNP